MNINKSLVCGRLTRDPELKALPSGSKVVSFSLATNHSYKKEDGTKVETTEFHNCKAFGKPAELIAQYCRKGGELYIEGRLATSSWEDATSGKKQYRTEIIVENFQFGAKAPGQGSGSQERSSSADVDTIEYPDDEEAGSLSDVPF